MRTSIDAETELRYSLSLVHVASVTLHKLTVQFRCRAQTSLIVIIIVSPREPRFLLRLLRRLQPEPRALDANLPSFLPVYRCCT